MIVVRGMEYVLLSLVKADRSFRSWNDMKVFYYLTTKKGVVLTTVYQAIAKKYKSSVEALKDGMLIFGEADNFEVLEVI